MRENVIYLMCLGNLECFIEYEAIHNLQFQPSTSPGIAQY